MAPSLASVYLLPFRERYVLFAPLHGVVALITARGASELHAGASDGRPPRDPTLGRWLRELRENAPSLPSLEYSPLLLGIIPTRACNGDCRYCHFDSAQAGPEVMSVAAAIRALDGFVEHARTTAGRVLKLHFFGGEPMMAPEVVVAVVHRARVLAARHGLRADLEITTNGQYSADWATFLGSYLQRIVLSLDGPQDIQDLHRPLKGGRSSFDAACQTARIIGDSPADLCLRCCVSQRNVAEMPAIAHWFCSELCPSCINFEVLHSSPEAERGGLLPPEPVAFATGFLRARIECAKVGVKVVYAADIAPPQWSSCPVGKDALIVSPDGAVAGCYLTPDRWQRSGLCLNVGRNDRELSVDRGALAAIKQIIQDKPRCERCFCRWSCAGGCHVDNTPVGAPLRYSDSCLETRIISMASLLGQLVPEDELQAYIADTVALGAFAVRDSDRLEDWGTGA
jgi:uncharacterized protein